MIISVRFWHHLKGSLFIMFTVLGIVIVFNEEQPSKHRSSIVRRPSFKEILSSLMHSENAYSPRVRTPPGISMLSRLEHWKNA